MFAEAIIEDNEMRIINFPKDPFLTGKHWKINIEPVEKIIDEIEEPDFISLIVSSPIKVTQSIDFFQRDEAHAR